MHSLLIAVGTRVRTLRKSRGLSQEDFALLCNLDRTYISDIERGARNVSIKNLHKMSYALGITLSELLRSVDEGVEPETWPLPEPGLLSF